MIEVQINILPDQLFRYYETLNLVEEELLANGINCLIVPKLPEEQAA